MTRKNHDNTVNIWRHVFSVNKWVPLYGTGTRDTFIAADNARWETSVFRSEIRSEPFGLPSSGNLKTGSKRLHLHLCSDLKKRTIKYKTDIENIEARTCVRLRVQWIGQLIVSKARTCVRSREFLTGANWLHEQP